MDYFSLEVDPKEEASAIFVSKVQKAIISVAMKKKINQSQLAKKLGVNRSVVHRMLSEKSNITLRTLGEICWALNVVPDFEVYDNDEVVPIKHNIIEEKNNISEIKINVDFSEIIAAYVKLNKDNYSQMNFHETKKVEKLKNKKTVNFNAAGRSDLLQQLSSMSNFKRNTVVDKRLVENV